MAHPENLFMRRIGHLILLMLFLMTSFTTAQYYFGRNKIQYNQFQWHILKTRHFDVYYYPEMESLAEIGAYYAEEAYGHLQDKFNFNILRRIPLVFYSSHFHFEETNTLPYMIPQGLGGFFEFIKGRVVIPCDGSLSRFRHTIRHELVHVFQRSFEARIIRNHRVPRHAVSPLWFTEGLAEFWSDGWDTEAEMIIRDGVLNNTLVPIQKIWRIRGTYLMYKEGQAILKYISETYGDYKIRQIMENFWKTESFSKAVEMALGKDLKALNEAWMYDLKKSIYPLLGESDFPRMVSRRITDSGYNTLPCYYRRDSVASIIFVANRDGYTSIYRKSLTAPVKAKPELLIRGEKTPQMESLHLQRSRMDVSSDGRLSFAAKSGPRDVLYLYDLETRQMIQGFQDSALVSLMSPAWSPDNRRIAFSGIDPSGRQDLYVLDIESFQTCRLTCDFFDDHDPDWSPDGNRLVFSSNRTKFGKEGCTNLFSIELSSREIRYLTCGPFHDRHPVWSRDGLRIAFSSDRNGTFNLWSIAPESSEETPSQEWDGAVETLCVRQLTQLATGAYYPCWTDSASLLFTAFENFGFQIREMKDIPACPDRSGMTMKDTLNLQPGSWVYPRISHAGQDTKIRYRRKFSLDFAQSQVIQDPIYGTSGGGQALISDMLGNEQYYFLLYNNARTRSEFWDGFNIAATRVDLSHRVNHAVGIYRLAGLYYNGYEGYFYERRYGGFGSVSYPLNKFERVETNLNVRFSEKERIASLEPRKAVLLSNFISYVRDNSLWGPTGPLDGTRLRVTLGNTVDIRHANVNFTTMILDFRRYFRVGLRVCHAVRLLGQFNQGKEALPFAMGGSWDLRGYRLWSLWGPKLVLISNELRFPFLDQFYLGFPFGGVGFSAIRGALFVDAGNVWNRDFGDWKGSFGFGIRFRLGGYLVLRMDMGRKTDFRTLDSETFTQFFFGWDF